MSDLPKAPWVGAPTYLKSEGLVTNGRLRLALDRQRRDPLTDEMRLAEDFEAGIAEEHVSRQTKKKCSGILLGVEKARISPRMPSAARNWAPEILKPP